MKYLLFSYIPPTPQVSSGIMLEQLCKMVPEGNVVCFVAKDPDFDVNISSDLSQIPHEIVSEPRGYSPVIGKLLSGTTGHRISFFTERFRDFFIEKKVIDRAVRFGRKNRVDCVWATLQGKTIITSARKIAQKLGVPLISMVWDDPSWFLDSMKTDKYSKKEILAEFDEVIRHSAVCGTASWVMAREYSEKYGVKTIPFLGSLDKGLAQEPAKSLHENSELAIGLAGQIYTLEEWKALLAALSLVDWKIAGRRVKIFLIGEFGHLAIPESAPVEKLGHMSLEETIKTLAGFDINYCPYFFAKERAAVSRTSFPSKLTAYLAAGRPVFFHGPEYSSPAKFIEEHSAGICCDSLEPRLIADKLSLLAGDTMLYAAAAANGRKVFDDYLTLDNLKTAFVSFLGEPFKL
jgi:hypothetical protein